MAESESPAVADGGGAPVDGGTPADDPSTGATLQDWWERAIEWITAPETLSGLVSALGILVAGWVASRIIAATVDRAFSRGPARTSQLLQGFCVVWARRGVLILAFFMALEAINIPVAPILAGLGVAGFIIGFAVQGTLSNFASGLMLLIYQPFDVGDVVEISGTVGKVTALSVVNTTLTTPDNRVVYLPNSNVWGNDIVNITKNPTRRVDMTLGVSYDADLDQVRQIVTEWLQNHAMVLEDPAPTVEVVEHGDSSVNFVVRPWVKTEDYWAMYWEAHRELKKLLDANGIEIPFPQRVVHMHSAG